MSRKKKFKAEVTQLLDLVINSLYSNRDIFLRELVSNASDAIDKARFVALTDKAIKEPEGGWKIRVEVDKEANTLTVIDNGIGMTQEEVEANIGTIANSGSKSFMAALEAGEIDASKPELIGQFGVGFYSAFMVAENVEVLTKRAGSDESAVSWESAGDGSYRVGDGERETHGTTITLHMKEDASEYVDEWKIKQIVKQYSNYVTFPIVMDREVPPPPADDTEDAEDDVVDAEVEGEEAEPPTPPEPVIEEERLNSKEAIWTRSKKDVTDEEHADFYKSLSHDWTPPARTIHFAAEGTQEFNALLYVPSKAPFDILYEQKNRGLHLYVKRVFIMNDCEELLPAYLRFVRGVVDSSDLSLNVSREILQESRTVRGIQKSLVSKVLGSLKSMLEKEREAYQAFFAELGTCIKEGLHSDHANRDKLQNLLLFRSSKTEGDERVTLAEYVARMHPDQEEIFYLTGDNPETVKQSPHLEVFKEKDMEVLYMVDHIDEWMLGGLNEYEEKKLKPINQGDIDLRSEDEKKAGEETRDEREKEFKSVIDSLSVALAEEIKEVRLSERLTESAACLVADTDALNPSMERLMRQMGQEVPPSKRILEVNPEHPVMSRLKDLCAGEGDDENATVGEYAELLYGQALITEGSNLKNPLRFTQLVSKLMAG